MLFAIVFAFWRVMEILTLIPTMGMLAWFVDGFVKANAMTPDYVLALFIVSVLGLAWAIFTLFSYHRSSTNAMAVAVVDMLFFGAFIVGVWFLRHIAQADCTHVTRDQNWSVNFGDVFGVSGADYDVNTDKPCAMLKACFAFGIMNCIFFFITAVLAWIHGGRMSRDVDRKYARETHYSRHGRRRSRSSGRRSHHSRSSYSRRVYV